LTRGDGAAISLTHGLNVQVETQYGKVIDRVLDSENLLGPLLPRHDDEAFSCLRFVDWYGKTIFNRPQMPTVLAELQTIRAKAMNPKQEALLDTIERLAHLALVEPHRHLKFVGD